MVVTTKTHPHFDQGVCLNPVAESHLLIPLTLLKDFVKKPNSGQRAIESQVWSIYHIVKYEINK